MQGIARTLIRSVSALRGSGSSYHANPGSDQRVLGVNQHELRVFDAKALLSTAVSPAAKPMVTPKVATESGRSLNLTTPNGRGGFYLPINTNTRSEVRNGESCSAGSAGSS